jgi:8-oxo-dGTP pyrophosphatase MutT (NUDIX family)
MNEIQKCGENRRASERFAIPGVGAIILKNTDGAEHVLLQDRLRPGIPAEHGLWEVPAGKIRAFESIFDALRREIKEETGLIVTEILGENEAVLYSGSDYEVINFTPFSCAQNLKGSYPIMVFVFLCRTSEISAGFPVSRETIAGSAFRTLKYYWTKARSCFIRCM